MNQLWIVTKTEFCRYFMSPLACIYLICFLLLNGACAFYFGNFFERGQADLIPMFIYQPWLYLVFIPAISMRMWAEEFRSKTILQLTTLPIATSTIVWGKFFATCLFCALSLFLTFPFWISVNILGNPDNMVILSGYLGSLLLAGTMTAISQMVSALTKNQVIALVIAVLINLLFFLSGLEFVLGRLRDFLSPALIDLVSSFSFLAHFETICLGLWEARDIVFFGSLILLFGIFNVLIICFRTSGTTIWFKSSSKIYYTILFIALLIGFVGINLLANTYLRNIQFDFTQEKIYTLTPATKKILNEIKNKTTARLYYSPILGERNPQTRILFDRVRLLLNTYADISGNKINVKIYNPLPLSDSEDKALAAGLQPMPIIDLNTNAYFGLVLSDERNNSQTIPFFPLARQNFIEQDLTEAIYLLQHKKPNLGLITSLPMTERVLHNVATPEWEIIKQLKRFYNLIYLPQDDLSLDKVDVLMIAHPRTLSSQAIDEIKKYSDMGGKILAFFDIATEALQNIAPTTEDFSASNYADLEKHWGISFINQAVVADLDNSSMIDASINYGNNPEFIQDAIQFYIKGQGFNQSSIITQKLQKIMLTSASIIVPLKDANIYFEPLLEAGKNSALLRVETVYERIHPAVILRNFKSDNNPKYLAAKIKKPSSKFELIAVGDSDLLFDSFWTEHLTILQENYSIPVLDNANFVLNALDELRGDTTLLSLRGKKYFERPFQQVKKMQIEATKNFKIKEKEIFDNIIKAQQGMKEILAKREFEERNNFTPDELAVIAKIRKKINTERQNLYQIRKDASAYAQNIKSNMEFINIYLLPILGLLWLLIPLIFKLKKNASNGFKPDAKIIILSCLALTLLALGLAATTFNQTDETIKLENTPLFVNLENKINSVIQIELKKHNLSLSFYKDDGVWKLKNYPNYLVYQNRIRSFLSALIEATYYEAKASGLETLPAFGLTPIEEEKSPATEIILQNDKGEKIINFFVGKYDLDLGRGSRGAYIRMANKFQVWLAEIDLIDLDINPQNWTYSTLWNLQFGRLISINNNKNTNYVANWAKYLLNTHLLSPQNNIDNPQLLLAINVKAENNIELNISFYKAKQKYYAAYNFVNTGKEDLLQKFATYANGIFYEISSSDMERLENANKFVPKQQ